MFGANALMRRRNSAGALWNKSDRVLEGNRDLLAERCRRAEMSEKSTLSPLRRAYSNANNGT